VVYTGETQNLLLTPIKFHDNSIVNASGFYSIGPYGVTLNITNLLDKRYYMAPTAAYTDVTAIPGLGREWRVTLKRSF
jgi:iron complex outermembrane receptor protein